MDAEAGSKGNFIYNFRFSNSAVPIAWARVIDRATLLTSVLSVFRYLKVRILYVGNSLLMSYPWKMAGGMQLHGWIDIRRFG